MSQYNNIRRSSNKWPTPMPPRQPKPPPGSSNHPRGQTIEHRGPRTRSIFNNSRLQVTTSSNSTKNSDVEIERILTTPLPDRPSSSLSKFRVLPEINTSNDWNEIDIMTRDAQRMILDSTQQVSATRLQDTNISGDNARRNPDKRKISQPVQITNNSTATSVNSSPLRKKTKTNFTYKQPIFKNTNKTKQKVEEQNEKKMLIAIKLPDGRRIERYFTQSSSINELMLYVQTQIKERIEDCDIYSMQTLPKAILSDWKLSLKQFNIKDRTVLYIEERDY